MFYPKHLLQFYYLSQALYYITVTQTLVSQHMDLVPRTLVPAYPAARATPSLVSGS